jgi:hypothetical protein
MPQDAGQTAESVERALRDWLEANAFTAAEPAPVAPRARSAGGKRAAT